MLIALLSDIHANRQAFEACLAQARQRGAERFVLLGDYVGYGADPDWCVSQVMQLAADGAIALLGNHDQAVLGGGGGMNPEATLAIEWTRRQLPLEKQQFLASLPLKREEDGRLYVHAEASRAESWGYVLDAPSASRSMLATPAHVTFCGHVHKPSLYSLSSTGKMTSFTPTTDAPVQLLTGRQWLVVLGAVGQPRDGNPAAAFALYDTDRREITFCRAAYDAAEAARRIRDNGLPPMLAERLLKGR